MAKFLKEWSLDAPWGKIALMSWGNPVGQPVLLVHGRQDSLSTFIPLLQLLPEDFYYVGIDLPGHGKSDPFPIGVMLSRIHFVTPVDLVIKHFNWDKFIYLAHSFGGEIGLYYNAIRPNRIKKMILLDSGIALKIIEYRPFPELYEAYEEYYNNYESYNQDDRVYSKRKALDSVMKARGLTEQLAELVLERNLNRIGDDKYRLSWNKQLKILTHLNLDPKQSYYLFTKNLPPTLFIAASESVKKYEHLFTGSFIRSLKETLKTFDLKIVDGTHDVHLTNPERMAGFVTEFMKKEFVLSKI